MRAPDIKRKIRQHLLPRVGILGIPQGKAFSFPSPGEGGFPGRLHLTACRCHRLHPVGSSNFERFQSAE